MAYRFPAHTVDPTRHSQEFIAWHKKAKPGHSREEDGMTWTKHEDGSLSVSRPGKEKKAMLSAFADELEKIATGMWGHAAEVGGLGILAAPHVYNAVTGKKAKEKTVRNSELAGLGLLAAPSVKALMKFKHAALTTAYRPAAGGVRAAIQQAAHLSAGGSATGKVVRNTANFVPTTPAVGKSWKTNPRAIALNN